MKVRGVNGGTPLMDNLCRRCTYAMRTQGAGVSEERISCGYIGHEHPVPFVVVECTQFSDRAKAGLDDMRRIAWTLETRGSRMIGFISPAERRRRGLVDDENYGPPTAEPRFAVSE